MKPSKKVWIGFAAGITLFLVAFGVAFGAVTLVQVSQTHPGVLSLTATVVISGDNIALWDTLDKQPITTPIQFTSVQTQAPLRSFRGIINSRAVWMENKSEYYLRPIDPAHEFLFSELCYGYIDARLENEVGVYRGYTGWSEWPVNWVMAPNDMWEMELRMGFECREGDLPAGDHSFEVVFGAIGGSGDALAASIQSISEAEALGRGPAAPQ